MKVKHLTAHTARRRIMLSRSPAQAFVRTKINKVGICDKTASSEPGSRDRQKLHIYKPASKVKLTGANFKIERRWAMKLRQVIGGQHEQLVAPLRHVYLLRAFRSKTLQKWAEQEGKARVLHHANAALVRMGAMKERSIKCHVNAPRTLLPKFNPLSLFGKLNYGR